MRRAAGDSPGGVRLRGMIVVLWRAGLRISEALALNESDLDSEQGAVLVRHGKGDQREVGNGAEDAQMREDRRLEHDEADDDEDESDSAGDHEPVITRRRGSRSGRASAAPSRSRGCRGRRGGSR